MTKHESSTIGGGTPESHGQAEATPGTASAQRPIRAVVYGVGAMGVLMTRLLLDKGVEIVGAVGRSETKVGQDLGNVANLGRELGVIVTNDADALFRNCEADIALVAVTSMMEPMMPHFRTCLSHGVDVLTLEEEAFYPWHCAPELSREIDDLARANGATFAASGSQDVYWSVMIAALMATGHRIERVRGRSTWHPDEFGPEVADLCWVGWTPEAAEEAAKDSSWGIVGRGVLDSLAVFAGLSPVNWDVRTVPILADQTFQSKRMPDLTVEAGKVRGVAEVVRMSTAEGIEMEFEMAGFVHAPNETAVSEWWIDGEPHLHLLNNDFQAGMITCTTAVNRVPDILSAPPGIVTVDKLPLPRYRERFEFLAPSSV